MMYYVKVPIDEALSSRENYRRSKSAKNMYARNLEISISISCVILIR